jgi:broad specificity phosphatase PhoE
LASLLLVRHGQASFFGPRYDRLSPLGERQARALGAHWAAGGIRLDRIYVGPRERHRRTCELVLEGYGRAGLAYPEPELLALLDEHEGVRLVKQVLRAPLSAALLEEDPPAERREPALREYLGEYLRVLRDWAAGRVAGEGVESYDDFSARARAALEALCGAGAGTTVAAFSSGGLICALAGELLSLPGEKVIELSLVLRNSAVCEVLHSRQRRSLVSFNAVPHLASELYSTV